MAHEHRRDVQDPVAERLRLGFFECTVQTVICAQASSEPAMRLAPPGEVLVKLAKGRFLRPQSFQLRIRSSTRA